MDRREATNWNEKPMRQPICILPDVYGDKLDPMSTIDYSRVYTVEHSVKAMPFGNIYKNSEQEFRQSFKAVFYGDDES